MRRVTVLGMLMLVGVVASLSRLWRKATSPISNR